MSLALLPSISHLVTAQEQGPGKVSLQKSMLQVKDHLSSATDKGTRRGARTRLRNSGYRRKPQMGRFAHIKVSCGDFGELVRTVHLSKMQFFRISTFWISWFRIRRGSFSNYSVGTTQRNQVEPACLIHKKGGWWWSRTPRFLGPEATGIALGVTHDCSSFQTLHVAPLAMGETLRWLWNGQILKAAISLQGIGDCSYGDSGSLRKKYSGRAQLFGKQNFSVEIDPLEYSE